MTRHRLLMILAMLALLGLVQPSASAQNGQLDPPEFRRLPAATIEKLLSSEWTAIERDSLDKLLELALENQKRPPEVIVRRAHYTARIGDGVLEDGRLNAEVHRLVDDPRLLSLSPSNLALTELNWKNSDAVWGATFSGNTVLHVDRAYGELEGRWSRDGRKRRTADEYLLKFPPAEVTRLTLRAAAGMKVGSDTGVVSQLKSTSTEETLWQIDLGQESQCRLLVHHSDQSDRREGRLLAEYSNRYLVRDDGTQMQFDLQIEVLNRPRSSVEFVLPPKAKLLSVMYGNDVSLNFLRKGRSGSGQIFEVTLPDEEIGKLRRIRLECFTESKLGSEWQLEGVRVPDSVFVSGLQQLEISRPLQLHGFEADGLLQTRAVMDGAVQEVLSFQQFLASARLSVHIDYPQTRVRVTSFTHVDVSRPSWQFQNQLSWEAESGYQFVCRVAIADGWRITDVKVPDADIETQIVSWDFRKRDQRTSLLTVEFANAVEPGQARSLILTGQRTAIMSRTELSIPMTRPLGVMNVDSTTAISATAGLLRPETINDWDFKTVQLSDVPDYVRDAQFWSQIVSTDQIPLCLQSVSRQARGTMLLNAEPTSVIVAPVVTAKLTENTIDEEFSMRIRPIDSAIETFHAFVSQKGPALEWEVVGNKSVELVGRRMPARERQRFGVPDSGELWELTFEPPLKTPVEIISRRSRVRTALDRISVLTTPDSENLTGSLLLEFPDELKLDIVAEGLQRKNLLGAGMRWSYSRADCRLTVRNQTGPGLNQQASLRLRSQIPGQPDSDELHWATYRLHDSKAEDFEFEIPEGAELIATRVNGVSTPAAHHDGRHRLRLQDTDGRPVVEIQYKLPSRNIGLRTRNAVPLPTTDYEVIELDWQVAMPQRFATVDTATGTVLAAQTRPVPWTRRLFGPLGRADHESIFDPRNGTRWVSTYVSDTAPDAQLDADSWTLGIQRWDIIAIVGGRPPASLGITVVDRVLIQRLSWVALGILLSLATLWRAKAWKRARVVAVSSAVLLVSLAVVLPPIHAQIAGGGLAGLLIAYSIPSTWLVRRVSRRRSQTSSMSTTGHYTGSVAGCILIAVVCLTDLRAQDPEVPETLVVNPSEIILSESPINEDGRNLAYIHRSLLQSLRLTAAPQSKYVDYLIRKADYEVQLTGQSPILNARYEVTVLSNEPVVRVHLPLSGASIGGSDGCRVNGQPHSITLSPDGHGWMVALSQKPKRESLTPTDLGADSSPGSDNVPAGRDYRIPYREPETFTIDLRLFPPSQLAGDRKELAIQIPVVASGRIWSTSGLADYFPVLVDGTDARPIPTTRNGDEGRVGDLQLGNADTIRVRWSTQPAVSSEPPLWNADVETLVEVQSNSSRWESSIQLTPQKGELPDVVLAIPNEAEGVSITGTNVLTYTARPDGLYVVEFDEPAETETDLQVAFLLPGAPRGQTVTIPGWMPFDLPEIDDQRITTNSVRQGITSSQNQTLLETATDSASTTRIASEIVRDSGRSQYAYLISKPCEFQYELSSNTPQRTISQNQEARVGANGIEWTLTAELQTSVVPAFQHRFRLPADFQIQSISVLEDGAERIVRWNRLENIVTLFLSGKTTGLQNIAVRGFVPRAIGSQFQLPELQFLNAEIAENYLTVYHAPDVDVQVLPESPDDVARVDGSNGTDASSGFLGRYEISPGRSMPQMNVTERELAFPVNAVISLTQSSADELKYSCRLEVPRNGTDPRPLNLAVTQKDSDRLEVRSEGKVIEPENSTDGQRTYRIEEFAESARTLTVSLSGTLSSDDQERFFLPQIQIDGRPDTECYVLCRLDEGKTVSLTSGDEIEWSDVPSFVRQSSLGVLSNIERKAFRLGRLEQSVVARFEAVPETPRNDRLGLVEHSIWITDQGMAIGRTRAFLRISAQQGELELTWPEETEVTAILLNDEVVNAQSTSWNESHSFTIAFDSDADNLIEIVDILWNKQTDRELGMSHMTIAAPRVGDLATVPIQVRLQSNPDLRLELTDGLEPQDPVSMMATRASTLLELCQRHLEYSSTPPLAWEALTETRRQLQLQADRNELSEFDSRILSQRLASLDTAMKSVSDQLSEGAVMVTSDQPSRADTDAARNATRETGMLASSAGSTENRLSLWVIPTSAFHWAAITLLGPIGLWIGLRLSRSRMAQAIALKHGLRSAILGLLWWLCFSLSPIGIVLLIGGIFYSVRGPVAVAESPSVPSALTEA